MCRIVFLRTSFFIQHLRWLFLYYEESWIEWLECSYNIKRTAQNIFCAVTSKGPYFSKACENNFRMIFSSQTEWQVLFMVLVSFILITTNSCLCRSSYHMFLSQIDIFANCHFLLDLLNIFLFVARSDQKLPSMMPCDSV